MFRNLGVAWSVPLEPNLSCNPELTLEVSLQGMFDARLYRPRVRRLPLRVLRVRS